MFIDAGVNGNNLILKSRQCKIRKRNEDDGMLNASTAGRKEIFRDEKNNMTSSNASVHLHWMIFIRFKNRIPMESNWTIYWWHLIQIKTLNNLSGEFLKTNFTATRPNNLLAYALKNQPLDGSLNVKSRPDNLMTGWAQRAWFNVCQNNKRQALRCAVSGKYQFVVNANVDKDTYDKTRLCTRVGSLAIGDETVKLNNVKAKRWDGTMTINGSYSTRRK